MRRRHLALAGAGLDEVRTGHQRLARGFGDARRRAQLARFDDHIQGQRARRVADLGEELRHLG